MAEYPAVDLEELVRLGAEVEVSPSLPFRPPHGDGEVVALVVHSPPNRWDPRDRIVIRCTRELAGALLGPAHLGGSREGGAPPGSPSPPGPYVPADEMERHLARRGVPPPSPAEVDEALRWFHEHLEEPGPFFGDVPGPEDCAGTFSNLGPVRPVSLAEIREAIEAVKRMGPCRRMPPLPDLCPWLPPGEEQPELQLHRWAWFAGHDAGAYAARLLAPILQTEVPPEATERERGEHERSE